MGGRALRDNARRTMSVQVGAGAFECMEKHNVGVWRSADVDVDAELKPLQRKLLMFICSLLLS